MSVFYVILGGKILIYKFILKVFILIISTLQLLSTFYFFYR